MQSPNHMTDSRFWRLAHEAYVSEQGGAALEKTDTYASLGALQAAAVAAGKLATITITRAHDGAPAMTFAITDE